MPMVACWVTHTTHLYVLYSGILLFPKYLKDVQGYSIKDIGDLAALPQVFTAVMIFSGSFIADWLTARGYRLLYTRRVMNFVGSVFPGLVACCYYFIHCDIVSAMICMITIQTLAGFQHPSSKANMNDIVPQFAATGMAIGNTFGSIMGFVAPNVAGALLSTYGNTNETWNMIWISSGCVMLSGGVFYTFFSSAEALPWARPEQYEKIEMDPEKAN